MSLKKLQCHLRHKSLTGVTNQGLNIFAATIYTYWMQQAWSGNIIWYPTLLTSNNPQYSIWPSKTWWDCWYIALAQNWLTGIAYTFSAGNVFLWFCYSEQNILNSTLILHVITQQQIPYLSRHIYPPLRNCRILQTELNGAILCYMSQSITSFFLENLLYQRT